MKTTEQLSLFGTDSPALTKTRERVFVDRIMEVVNSFRRPNIVMPGYEDMRIPPDIERAIFIERFILAKEGRQTATETEGLWYLSNCSLVGPFSHSWYRIFMYLFQEWAKRNDKEIPKDLQEQVQLESHEEYDLQHLRDWLYRRSMQALK